MYFRRKPYKSLDFWGVNVLYDLKGMATIGDGVDV